MMTSVQQENARLQQQVSLSNIKTVQTARREKLEAEDKALQASHEAKKAKERADNAEAAAKRKYEELAEQRRSWYRFLGFYAVIVTALHFIVSARCRSDTLDFLVLLGNIMDTVAEPVFSMFSMGALHIILACLCLIGIIVLMLIGVVLLLVFYGKICVDAFMDTEGARFRTWIIGLCSVVIPIYVIEYLPQESINLWGLTILVQIVYVVGCVIAKQ